MQALFLAALLSPELALADLAHLETLLARRYAYFPQARPDYRQALGAVSTGISRHDFALLVDGLLARLGDGHTRVRFRDSGLPRQTQRKKDGARWLEWSILPGGAGYLRLRLMPPGEPPRRELVEAMRELRRTRGLILDLRGNSGGSREPVLALLGFFIPPGRPYVLNVAAFRLPAPESNDRHLFPRDWPRWSAEEREAVELALKKLKPPFHVSRELYSDWHAAVLRPAEGSYFYDRPLIVLQDEGTASAADLLLAALKGRPLVTLLGRKSSGGSGYALPYALPRSGIVVQLSSMVSLKPDGSLYTGTEPDAEGGLEHARQLLSR